MPATQQQHVLHPPPQRDRHAAIANREGASSPVDVDVPSQGVVPVAGPEVAAAFPRPVEGRTCRDPIWLGLFVIHLLVVGYFLYTVGIKNFRAGYDKYRNTENYWPQLGLAGAIGAVLGWAWLTLLFTKPVHIIKLSFHGVTTYLAVISVLCFWGRHRSWGIVFACVGVLQFVYTMSVLDRVPFAILVMKKAMAVLALRPAATTAALVGLALELAWMGLWTFGVSGAIANSDEDGVHWWLVTLFAVSLFWTGAVLANIMHVMVAGVVALAVVHSADERVPMPRYPTLSSLRHALTTSLGSICLGSLFTAAFRVLRWMVRSVRARTGKNECCNCCLACLFGFVEGFVRFFNKYAYVQAALDGKPFNKAARDAWERFQMTGVEALIAYDVTGAVIVMMTMFGGLVTGTCAGLWTYYMRQDRAIMIALASMLMGMMLVGLALVVVESAITCLYVCYAVDPTIVARWDPEFAIELERLLRQRMEHRSGRNVEAPKPSLGQVMSPRAVSSQQLPSQIP